MAAPPWGAATSNPSRTFADVLSSSTNEAPIRPPERYKGMPAVTFSDEDIQYFASDFKFALIGKFSKGRPSMAVLRKSFELIGFGGAFNLGLIDHRHILINFDREEDFQRCWLRKSWSIQGSIMKIFKWTPDFRPDMESPIVPVWIALEGLPAHLQKKRAMYSIANLIGSPLKVDASTLAHNRPSVSRVCVDLNVSKPIPEFIWINNGSYGGFAQPVTYEYIPPYCNFCKRFGHLIPDCKAGQPPYSTQHQRQEADPVNLSKPQPQANTTAPPRKLWRPVITQPQEETQNSQQQETETKKKSK